MHIFTSDLILDRAVTFYIVPSRGSASTDT